MEELRRLDKAKRRYLEAKAEIEDLRLRIALARCPLGVGDRVTVVDGDQEFDGVVEQVGVALEAREMLGPVVGTEPGWAAGGHRIKKSDGGASKWSFGLTSFDADLRDGRWVVKARSIEDALGLPSLKP